MNTLKRRDKGGAPPPRVVDARFEPPPAKPPHHHPVKKQQRAPGLRTKHVQRRANNSDKAAATPSICLRSGGHQSTPPSPLQLPLVTRTIDDGEGLRSSCSPCPESPPLLPSSSTVIIVMLINLLGPSPQRWRGVIINAPASDLHTNFHSSREPLLPLSASDPLLT